MPRANGGGRECACLGPPPPSRVRAERSGVAGLHRYYDLQPALSQRWSQAQRQGGEAEEDVDGAHQFQYAALSLGALSHHFGHSAEAEAAVREAVRIAQENGDQRCLQYALGWLSEMGGEAGLADKFAESTAGDETAVGQHLHLLARLAQAKCAAAAARPPREVLALVAVHSGDAQPVVRGRADTEAPDKLGLCAALSAGLFDLYGHSGLSVLHAQLLLRGGHASTAPGEGCAAYCRLAAHAAGLGDRALARKLLAEAEVAFPAGGSCVAAWRLAATRLQHHWALQDRDWAAAAAAQEEMAAMAHLESGAADDAAYRVALAQLERGQFQQAADGVSALLEATAGGLAAPFRRVRLLALRAEVALEAGAPFLALPDATEAVVTADRLHARLMAATSRLLVAAAQRAASMPAEAEQGVRRALPVLLAHGSLEERGKAWLELGRCRRAAEGDGVPELGEAQRAFAAAGAQRLEATAWHELALSHHRRGDTAERDRCAERFVQ